MTDAETSIYNDIAGRLKAILGHKPTQAQWIEQACDVIQTQQELIAVYLARISKGLIYSGCNWGEALGTAKPRVEAVVIVEEERREHPTE